LISPDDPPKSPAFLTPLDFASTVAINLTLCGSGPRPLLSPTA